MKDLQRVENSGGITASLAGRYASALYDLARDRGQVDTVESDLKNLGEAVRESDDLASLIRNPEIGREAAAGAMDGVAQLLGAGPLARNFLGVLAANRRLGSLPDMIRAFATIAAAARGELTAQVTSAHPLDAGQIDALAAKLKEREGRDVKIDASVDPELLGGLVVQIGSRQIDSSIRTRLNSLANAMKG
ncbi:F0F1 ATP synthase subunit delta [Novosphingobium tardum]|uniref:ATP synthase subunit delta n=1 Tax=Novosphingobium tardum TaxID=1538021 RepID=A0ABV8RRB4_9SPHN